ncbi:hypothetical protein GCK32_002249 [Trichostrongylus colubriformis]|uniref:Uncharacterized protein n=1 Tax=Trichostrongylus colubriformis TaxID=6319 RepID=A0AAN8J3E3_TRICO
MPTAPDGGGRWAVIDRLRQDLVDYYAKASHHLLMCGSQTLNELVEGLTSRKATSTDTISYKSTNADDVQVVPCVIRKKPRFAPKILKKKSSLNKVSKEPNVKHVTFEGFALHSRSDLTLHLFENTVTPSARVVLCQRD